MITLIFIALLGLAAYFAHRFIRAYDLWLYIFFLALALLAFIFIDSPLSTPFKQGFLGLAFYYIVMITGALKKKSKLRIAFMKVRKEYSILGFIAITPHALHYFLEYLDGQISIPILGIIAYAIMIPLFITSFMVIRKRMTYKSWNLLQSLAYVVYVGLFIHLILNFSEPINRILYFVMFITYFVLKIIHEIKERKNKVPVA